MEHCYVTRSVFIKHRAKRALFQIEQKSYRKTALRLTYLPNWTLFCQNYWIRFERECMESWPSSFLGSVLFHYLLVGSMGSVMGQLKRYGPP